MEGKNIKLYYLDLYGKGEIIRSILHYNKVQFEDIRFTRTEWMEKKHNFQFNQIPILEIDGKQLSQSISLARYIAKLYGQYPTDPLEIYQIESIIDFFRDMSVKLTPWIKENDSEKKKIIEEECLKNTLPGIITVLNNILKQNTTGSGFFVGKSLSLADFAVVNFVTRMLIHPDRIDCTKFILDANPELAAYIKEKTEGEFKEYLSTRKSAPF